MDLVAVGWIALQMTGSPFMVAVAAFARSAPMMVLGPFAGIVADRVSRAHLLLVTQAGGAVIALAFLAMFAVDAAGYWPLVALEGAFGILWSLDFPARRTALFSMLGASRVAQAVSLETVSMQIAKMVGPVVAGACLASLGPAACYAVMLAALDTVPMRRGVVVMVMVLLAPAVMLPPVQSIVPVPPVKVGPRPLAAQVVVIGREEGDAARVHRTSGGHRAAR